MFRQIPTKFENEMRELALLFLKLGTTAFGGPAAHISMMQDEVVRKRKWVSEEEFLDLLSAINFIPGPNSTELAIHIGYKRNGYKGLFIAGAMFILPAVLIVSVIADFYRRYGALPLAVNILSGIKPVIIAIIAQAVFSLGKTALKTKFLFLIFIFAAALNILGVNELLVLIISGFFSYFICRAKSRSSLSLLGFAWFSSKKLIAAEVVSNVMVPFNMTKLFLFFLKVGSILFGSGYVLLSFLRSDLVEKYGWLTDRQLMDAIAVGQFTPGPVFTTATFIGYILSGPFGAVLATIGIFLPAFIFVAISAPIISKLRSSASYRAILDGINVASLALMTVVTLQFSRTALTHPLPIAVTLVSFVLLMRFRINSAWLILLGAIVGLF